MDLIELWETRAEIVKGHNDCKFVLPRGSLGCTNQVITGGETAAYCICINWEEGDEMFRFHKCPFYTPKEGEEDE